MKKSNKGFSLVELIIVIAIMAILAGALAPALMKYINKSRLSTDISTGQTVANAIQAALSNEKAYDNLTAAYKGAYNKISATYKDFGAECENVCKSDKAVHKAKKDMNGDTIATQDASYYVEIDPVNNVIEVYYGSDKANMVYPTVTDKLKEKTK